MMTILGIVTIPEMGAILKNVTIGWMCTTLGMVIIQVIVAILRDGDNYRDGGHSRDYFIVRNVYFPKEI